MKLALLIVLALCAACVDAQPVDSTVAHDIAAKIQYTRDARTNLCFAMVSPSTYSGYRVLSTSNVPCEAIPASLLTLGDR